MARSTMLLGLIPALLATSIVLAGDSTGPSPSKHDAATTLRGLNPLYFVSTYSRLRVVRSLIKDGRNDEALREVLTLWKDLGEQTEPGNASVRCSVMKAEMKLLVKAYKPARTAFITERDRIAAQLKTDQRSFADLDNWLMLNELVGQQQASLDWLDRIKREPDAKESLEHAGMAIRQLLVDKGRWADVGLVDTKPLRLLRLMHGVVTFTTRAAATNPQKPASAPAYAIALWQNEASILYVGQLAAGNEQGALDVLSEAVRLDPSADLRVALVRKALGIGQFRKHMVEQLDLAEKAGADVKTLREQLLRMWAQSAG